MKKICLLLLLGQISILSYSQLDKKTWLVGGVGNLSSTKNTFRTDNDYQEFDQFSLTISPNIGYFISDKFVAGLSQNLGWFTAEVTTSGGIKNNNIRYDLGPFLRYYFLDEEKPFNVFADVNYTVGIFKRNDVKGTRNATSFRIGSAIFFNESIALEITGGYNSNKEKIPSFTISSQKGLIMGIGIQIHLFK